MSTNQDKKNKTYPWKNVAVFETYQEAYQKRYDILNEDVMARLQTKISKQTKGFVVKTRVKPGLQKKEELKKAKKKKSQSFS
jgi:DNA-binding transcriptional MocR family regulator